MTIPETLTRVRYVVMTRSTKKIRDKKASLFPSEPLYCPPEPLFCWMRGGTIAMAKQSSAVCDKTHAAVAGWRLRMQLRPQIPVVLLALLAGISAGGQTSPDFTGHWGQDTGSESHRHLDIEQNGLTLQVKTTVTTSKGSRRLEVTYRNGGPVTVYKGLDGDTFRSSAHWDGSTLVFETIESEDGNEIPEKTVWTLSEDRNSFQVKRRSTKSTGKGESFATYVREP